MIKIKKQRTWKGIKVIDYYFPENQYYKQKTEKTRIDLHHMASGESIKGDLNWWLSNKSKVATCVAIQRNGDISTMFSSNYWAHALGVKIKEFDKFSIKRIYRKSKSGKLYVANNEILNQGSIACELDSWGRLTKKGNNYYSWTGKKIDPSLVYSHEETFRGQKYFEKYTDKQIKSLEKLLIFWRDKYDIDISYKGEIIFKQNKRALSGEPGVWSHTSYREDKDDIHPQKELIQMLKSL